PLTAAAGTCSMRTTSLPAPPLTLYCSTALRLTMYTEPRSGACDQYSPALPVGGRLAEGVVVLAGRAAGVLEGREVGPAAAVHGDGGLDRVHPVAELGADVDEVVAGVALDDDAAGEFGG